MIKKPYLLFLGDAHDRLAAKVAIGINDWRPQYAVGQIRLEGCNADLGIDEISIAEAVERGAKTMVIGVANRGGVISEGWKPHLLEALEAGMDLASGLHVLLNDQPDLVDMARKHGRKLFDVRKPNVDYPIADGQKRSGKRCVAVGTDVSVGKMYVSLALHQEMLARGMKTAFRATGQTGILVEGDGVPLDAVVADFMAGSIEYLSPAQDDDHWDFIEGQGSLFHASYSGVTLSIIHGGQPDALILCHEPTREFMRGLPGYKLPSLEALRDLSLTMAKVVNPDCKVAGISLNTRNMEESEARKVVDETEQRMGLPTTDPVRFGVGRIVDSLLSI